MSDYASDCELIQIAIDWLHHGHTVALVTVARTWGSAPRPVGSLMLMRKDGVFQGSVSGGCVEEDLVTRYREGQLAGHHPVCIDYGVNQQQAARFGLPCGGRLELVVESLDNTTQLQLLLNKMNANELASRRLCLHTGEVSLHLASANDEFSYTTDYLQKVFGPRWLMLLIGAGHLSQNVARLALMLDYRVIVCDPRPEYHQAWQESEMSEATGLTSEMPDDAVRRYAQTVRTAVVALSHDPRLDDMALLDALSANLFYVGAVGSRASNAQRRQRLQELGLSSQELDRLHAPVGLDIGSHTPAEIAVSILAEITALRNRAHQPQLTTEYDEIKWQF